MVYVPEDEKRGTTVEERMTFVRERPARSSQLPLIVGFLLLIILMIWFLYPDIFSAFVPVSEFQLDSLDRIL